VAPSEHRFQNEDLSADLKSQRFEIFNLETSIQNRTFLAPYITISPNKLLGKLPVVTTGT
jgi:hypothetical protein